MHPMDVYHQYNRLSKQRETRRKDDKGVGTYILCPGSFTPGMKAHALELFIRTTSKTKKPFASCDSCGLWMRFWGCYWKPEGEWFGFSRSEAEALLMVADPIIQGIVQHRFHPGDAGNAESPDDL